MIRALAKPRFRLAATDLGISLTAVMGPPHGNAPRSTAGPDRGQPQEALRPQPAVDVKVLFAGQIKQWPRLRHKGIFTRFRGTALHPRLENDEAREQDRG